MEAADDLVIGQLKVAKVLQAMEDWVGTIDRLNLAIQQADNNAAQSGVFKSDPIFTRMKLAEVLLQSGSPKDAKDTCSQLIPKIEELVAKSPEDSVWRRRHYQIYTMLAEAEAKLDNHDQSRRAYQKALELARSMIADGQRVETVQADAAEIEKQLSDL
jgi:predicted Zn-dependent protease